MPSAFERPVLAHKMWGRGYYRGQQADETKGGERRTKQQPGSGWQGGVNSHIGILVVNHDYCLVHLCDFEEKYKNGKRSKHQESNCISL